MPSDNEAIEDVHANGKMDLIDDDDDNDDDDDANISITPIGSLNCFWSFARS